MSLLTYEGDFAGDDDADGRREIGGTVGGNQNGFAAILSAAQSAAADIALITDAGQAIVHVSDSFTAMTGYDLTDLVGLNCRVMQGPGTDPETRRQMRDVISSKEVFEGQILNYRKDGSAFWTALKIIPVQVGDSSEVTHFVSVQRDISNKVALLKQVQTQALIDHVTGLPNRSAAEQAVTEVVDHVPHPDPEKDGLPDRASTAAVCLIDLDDFRIVNNTLGHAAGDAVLQQWAARVLSRLREGDVLARMGGDEFLLILTDIARATSDEDLQGILNRIHEAVEQPFPVEGQHIRIGMSMGIALVPEDGTDTRAILRRADQALYAAKGRHDKGGRWWETAAQAQTRPLGSPNGSSTTHRASTAGEEGVSPGGGITFEDYRGAVRTGNILVHFQPLIDLRDGSVTLFEALARLKLPDGQVVYPDRFLPHLGADDLRTLFAHVLDQGLGLISAWDRDGVRPNMAVNLPPEILHDRTLPTLVDKLLRTHDIEPGGLGLELLESQTLGLEAQRVALQELAGLGVRLAMDDLGSGYSSLQRLSSFPFTAIKLDRSLFQQANERPLETLSVMATLIQMGRDLGMTVVIEGLENEALTEAAIILGAPLGQGYYLAEPMAPADCALWFDSFKFELHQSPIQTPLGALAYHWQFARLAAPHPLSLESCPLTRFIQRTTTNANPYTDTKADADADAEGIEATTSLDIESWHALQHTPQGIHPASSRLFINWLIQNIHTHDPVRRPGSCRPSESL